MDDLLIIPRAILAVIGAILFMLFLLFVALLRAVLRQTNMLRALIDSDKGAKVLLKNKKDAKKTQTKVYENVELTGVVQTLRRGYPAQIIMNIKTAKFHDLKWWQKPPKKVNLVHMLYMPLAGKPFTNFNIEDTIKVRDRVITDSIGWTMHINHIEIINKQ